MSAWSRGTTAHALLLAALVVPATSHAQDPEARTTSEWVRQAEELERAGDPAGALDAWARVRDADPRARLARRAERRIAWLEERHGASWEPLGALLRFQSEPDDARNAARVEAFARTIDAIPEGRVRIESRLAIAGAWSALGDPRAADAYRALLREPELRDGERALAREALAQAHAARGDEGAGIAELEAANLEESSVYRVLVRRARARVLEPIAWSSIAAYVLAVLAALGATSARGEALRAAFAPSRIALALWLALVPYAIARAYEDESHGAFELLAPASLLVVLLGHVAGAALPPERRRARVGVASLAALAALAAGYLAVLHRGEALPFG